MQPEIFVALFGVVDLLKMQANPECSRFRRLANGGRLSLQREKDLAQQNDAVQQEKRASQEYQQRRRWVT
jgi:hypothetical protein